MNVAVILGLAAVLDPARSTWDEPWHEKVVQEADCFVRLRVTACDGRSLSADVLASLAGEKTAEKVVVDGFYALDLRSMTAGHGPELRFKAGFEGYFFLKKAKDRDAHLLATPTAGYAAIGRDGVVATYRHSCHMALVETSFYEKTQVAIFEHLHGRPHDKDVIRKLFDDLLKQPPQELVGGDAEKMAAFFRQHVALECFYHFGEEKDYPRLEPFLKAASQHVQISAVRALSRIDTRESRARLLEFLKAPGRDAFAKAMAVWGLRRLAAREAAPEMEKYMADGPEEKCGFALNIMDPRIGTKFPPSVKDALRELLEEWKKAGPPK